MTLRTSSGEDATKSAVVETPDTVATVPDTGQPDTGATDANLETVTPDPSAASTSAADETKDAKKEPTLAEVIKTAAQLDGDGKSSTPAKDGTKVEVDKVKDGEVKAAVDDKKAKPEDDKNLPFHNHPRWKEVVGERDTLKERVSKLEPDAEQYGKITSFMTEHQLSPDEVGEGFVIMAMIKAADPRALERLDDYRNRVAVAIGDVLPEDLKTQVDTGALTEAAAKEVSRARVTTARATTEATKARETANKVTADNAEAAVNVERMKAADDWALEKASKDPDFGKKEPVLKRYAQALMAGRGHPRNRAETIKLMDDAYTEVNKTFASAMPKKETVKRLDTTSSNSAVKPVPKTLADAVRLAAAVG